MAEANENIAAVLFQSNPMRWDLRKDFEPGQTVRWLASKHRAHMQPGKLALFWVARGEEAAEVRGLYGWGVVLEEPSREGDEFRVPLRYEERWLARIGDVENGLVAPLPAQDVLSLPSWRDHLLNSNSRGSNFEVTSEQLQDLVGLVGERFPNSQFLGIGKMALEGLDLRRATPDHRESTRKPQEPEGDAEAEGSTSTAQKVDSIDLPFDPHLHSDLWTLEDHLGYSVYAKAIEQFVRHQGTNPTLVIAILAPWGQGKTTLMQLIKREFETQTAGGGPTEGTQAGPGPAIDVQATFRDLRKWLDDPDRLELVKLKYPTVWFNAWHFESSEQVWAGLAHTIITQLVEKLPNQLQRERFWLELQARRLDFNVIRQDVYTAVFEKFLPKALFFGVVGIASLVAAFFGTPAFFGISLKAAITGSIGLATLGPIGSWLWSRRQIDTKPLEGKFEAYVRQPNYQSQRGFLTEVQEDVARVFELLVDKGEPAVVFIDDLDRCSPMRVAAIMEALNHFVGGPLRAYFVIGMDAQVVAAAMELAHETLKSKLDSSTRPYGSVGWHYMEKFIQLQFVLPSMSDTAKREYLAHQFSSPAVSAAQVEGEADVAQHARERAEAALGNPEIKASELVERVAKDLPLVRRHDPTRSRKLAERVLEKAAPQLDDRSPIIRALIETYAADLGANPRAIKRFVNLLRFYVFSQWARRLEGLESAPPDAIARWIVIMLRWPELVRWVQWDGEDALVEESDPSTKAERFEDLARKSDGYEPWKNALDERWPDRNAQLKDRQLWAFLRKRAGATPVLSRAIEVGIW